MSLIRNTRNHVHLPVFSHPSQAMAPPKSTAAPTFKPKDDNAGQELAKVMYERWVRRNETIVVDDTDHSDVFEDGPVSDKRVEDNAKVSAMRPR